MLRLQLTLLRLKLILEIIQDLSNRAGVGLKIPPSQVLRLLLQQLRQLLVLGPDPHRLGNAQHRLHLTQLHEGSRGKLVDGAVHLGYSRGDVRVVLSVVGKHIRPPVILLQNLLGQLFDVVLLLLDLLLLLLLVCGQDLQVAYKGVDLCGPVGDGIRLLLRRVLAEAGEGVVGPSLSGAGILDVGLQILNGLDYLGHRGLARAPRNEQGYNDAHDAPGGPLVWVASQGPGI
mmetsp:Transcript_44082/g.95889  ORF Transcript_44082/g.95889 Transcript_44082/m.95889 type:complete len:231 (-) Transcript_44082:42-734(-)